MIKPSKAEKVLGRIEKGVHLLERGVAAAHSAYRVGQAIAPIAAAMFRSGEVVPRAKKKDAKDP